MKTFVAKIGEERPGKVIRDSKGNIISLILPRGYGNDRGLEFAASIGSVRELKVFINQGSPDLTVVGIRALSTLTNLECLRLWCPGL